MIPETKANVTEYYAVRIVEVHGRCRSLAVCLGTFIGDEMRWLIAVRYLH